MSRGWMRSTFVVIVFVSIGVLLPPVVPQASAAGNPGLDSHIVSDPLDGGVAFAPSYVVSLANQLENVEKSVLTGTHTSVVVAAEGWHPSNSTAHRLLIALIAFTTAGASPSSMSTQASIGARSAAASVCSGATGDVPAIDVPVSGVPNSHYVVCKPAPSGVHAVAMTTSRANVIAIIFSTTQTVSRSQLSTILLHQYDAMSADEAATTPDPNAGLLTGLIVAGVFLLVIVGGVILLVRRQRRVIAAMVPVLEGQAAPVVPPLPPAGWYPDPEGRPGTRYWTGDGWGPPISEGETHAESTEVAEAAPPVELDEG